MEKWFTYLLFRATLRKLELRGLRVCILWGLSALLFIPVQATSQNSVITVNSDTSLSIEEIFDMIKKQTDNTFIYRADLFEGLPKVQLKKGKVDLDQLLSQSLQNRGFEYTVSEDNSIILNKVKVNQENLSKEEVLPETNVTPLIDVSGKVIDSEGLPLIGVNVLVKGTNKGVSTDFDGNFSLEGVDENAILLISYIGYQTIEVTVSDDRALTIILQEDSQTLDEIVVVGYGSVKKSDLTGSVSNLKGELIEKNSIRFADEVLRGQVAGVNVRNTTSEPGAPITIRIRGAGSISSGSQPLFVIDGIPVGTEGLQTISPNDIASVDVLKDASSTAIYGARGANGVVVITTKSGSYSEKTKFNYSSFFGVQEVSRKIPMMNRDEIIEYVRASNDNANHATGANVYFPEDIPNSQYPDIDYQDLIFQNAPTMNHQLSANGGSENFKYYFSGTYLNQQGVVKYSNLDRFSFKSNIEAKLTPKLKLGSNITYTYSNNDKSWTHSTNIAYEGNNIVGQALTAYPYEPVKNDDGSYVYSDQATVSLLTNRARPIPDMEGIDYNVLESRLLSNLYLEYEIVDGLKFKTSLATDNSNGKTNQFLSTLSNRGRLNNGQASTNSNNRLLLVNENTINWNKEIDDIHNFDIVGGTTVQNITNTALSGTSSGFVNDAVMTYSMNSGTVFSAPINIKTKSTIASFFGRVNYKLDNKYLFTFTSRADGSSKFGANNKWGFFPSGAVAWRASEERFIKNIDVFSDLKFRASYGVTGNQEIGLYNTQSRLSTSLYPINESLVNMVNVNTFANEDLKWETTTQLNFGVDFGFFNHRLNFILDYYHKKTSDLLLNIELPYSSGFNTTLQNTGVVENKGFEAAMNAVILDNKFQWDVSANFHINRNEISDLGSANPFYVSGPSWLGWIQSPIIREGISLGEFQGWVQDGLFRNQADADAYLAEMDPSVVNDIQVHPGFPKIVDQNGDGRINNEDVTSIGNPYPDFEFGFSNNLSYKNFDFSFFMQGMIGHDILNLLNQTTLGVNFVRDSQQKRVVGNYWTEDNQDALYTKPSENVKLRVPQRGTDFHYVEDGTFVRLKNVSLGYTFEDISFADRARFYVSVNNALTFTDYYGFDPEVNDFGNAEGSQGVNWGVDQSSYPQSRTYLFGLNIIF